MENSLATTDRAVARRKAPPTARSRTDEVRPVQRRAPAKQREGGWGLYQWLAWQDRLLPGLSSTQRQPLVCEICGIREAMYYKLNSGTQFPSERVQRRCELAELASRVASGEDTSTDQRAAKRLLDDRETELILIAYQVLKGTIKDSVRKQAAKAALTAEIKALQKVWADQTDGDAS